MLRSDRRLPGSFAGARRAGYSTIDHVLKFIRIGRTRERHVQRDRLPNVGIRQALIERLHTRLPGSGLHR